MLNPILVVDSRRSSRDEIVDALDRAGFIGIPAASGRAALDYLGVGGDARVILLEGTTRGDMWTSFRDAQRQNAALARIPMIAIAPTGADERFEPEDDGSHADVEALIGIVKHLCAAADAQRAPAR